MLFVSECVLCILRAPTHSSQRSRHTLARDHRANTRREKVVRANTKITFGVHDFISILNPFSPGVVMIRLMQIKYTLI